MTKQCRICVPLWLSTLALLAALSASERVRRRNKKARKPQERTDGE
jgi:hypothetical protein